MATSRSVASSRGAAPNEPTGRSAASSRPAGGVGRLGVPRVAVAQPHHVVVADDRRRLVEFGSTHLGQALTHPGKIGGRIENVPLLTTGAAHQHGPHTLVDIAGHGGGPL